MPMRPLCLVVSRDNILGVVLSGFDPGPPPAQPLDTLQIISFTDKAFMSIVVAYSDKHDPAVTEAVQRQGSPEHA